MGVVVAMYGVHPNVGRKHTQHVVFAVNDLVSPLPYVGGAHTEGDSNTPPRKDWRGNRVAVTSDAVGLETGEGAFARTHNLSVRVDGCDPADDGCAH